MNQILKSRSFKAFTILIIILFIYSGISPNGVFAKTYNQEQLILKSGTLVQLVLNETLSSKTSNTGDQVILNVAKDVVVNGFVVIKQGTVTLGEIVNAKKSGAVGKSGELSLMVRSVQSVDGTLVNLSGKKTNVGEEKLAESVVLTLLCCILFLLMPGEDVEFSAGTIIDAYVLNDVKIESTIEGVKPELNTTSKIILETPEFNFNDPKRAIISLDSDQEIAGFIVAENEQFYYFSKDKNPNNPVGKIAKGKVKSFKYVD